MATKKGSDRPEFRARNGTRESSIRRRCSSQRMESRGIHENKPPNAESISPKTSDGKDWSQAGLLVRRIVGVERVLCGGPLSSCKVYVLISFGTCDPPPSIIGSEFRTTTSSTQVLKLKLKLKVHWVGVLDDFHGYNLKYTGSAW
jgi:hypothetical protein